ncbi:haloacid dehalogenase type II [Roseitranquillus sediminis]|uniref:haloacid dehalogenase type II n=1 Tax=Roseitranquillus sediminis TaxID=2809051 RepID=UPI001D0CD12D|nr:haloacid dehalogenase type II [Roseitranquillus sediminis]
MSRICIFDAYGTLFDVGSAARRAAAEPGREALAERWQALAEAWRQKQLQYTWLRAITGEHADFWQVTQDALDWALEAAGLENEGLRPHLLDLYRELDAFPEVPATLGALKDVGCTCAILSNGAPGMLADAVASAGIGGWLDDVLLIESVGVFKPDARVYDMVGQRFDCRREDVLFVSSNGWDAAGAASYGFVTVWANRRGEPVDRLPGRPQHVVPDLARLPDLLETV